LGEASARPPAPPLTLPPPAKEGRWLDEAEGKKLLRRWGLSVPEGARAGNTEEAVEAATRLGFPVALKALGIAHKSEANAVRLNRRDAEDVRRAAEALTGIGTGHYVERMIEG